WKTTTFTGALRLTGMTAPFVYDGAMNGNVFVAGLLRRTLQIASTRLSQNQERNMQTSLKARQLLERYP
ncbi:hypothetical protein SAMN02927914_06836, partial [Mesorhizobium qingshengii]